MVRNLKTLKNKIKNTGIFGHFSYVKIWQEKEGDEQNDWYNSIEHWNVLCSTSRSDNDG